MTQIDVLSIEEYFNGMPISEEEKKRRIEFAKQMEELFIILFVLMRQQSEDDYFDTSSTEQRVEDVLEDNGVELTPTIKTLVRERVADIVDITKRHMPDDKVSTPDGKTPENGDKDPWYTSPDRAKILAEEETNTLLNRDDFDRAKASGKRHKKWLSMKDLRVRPTHKDVDEEVIPIDQDFIVGGHKMAFPRDTKGPAHEVNGCRCYVEYLP